MGTTMAEAPEPPPRDLAGMTDAALQTYRLYVLGTRELVGPGGTRVTSVLAQPKRLCLLTYLVLARGPVARGKLAALFWPESDEGHARNALSQAVFYLRKSLDKGAIESVEGDLLVVPPERVWCDARDLLAGERLTAELVEAARGEILEGWNADDSQPLQEWLDGVRREAKRTAATWEPTSDASTLPTDLPVAAPSETPPASEPGREGSAQPTRRPARRVAVVAVVAATLAFLWAVTSWTGRADPAVARAEVSIVIVGPKLSAVDGEPLAGLEDAIRLETSAAIAALPGVVVTLSAAPSGPIARLWMEAVGEPKEDKWVLEVAVTEGPGRVRAVMLFDGAGQAHSAVFEEGYTSIEELLMELPTLVAERVASKVLEVIDGPRSEGPPGKEGG